MKIKKFDNDFYVLASDAKHAISTAYLDGRQSIIDHPVIGLGTPLVEAFEYSTKIMEAKRGQ